MIDDICYEDETQVYSLNDSDDHSITIFENYVSMKIIQ